jgi:hypothetical protein
MPACLLARDDGCAFAARQFVLQCEICASCAHIQHASREATARRSCAILIFETARNARRAAVVTRTLPPAAITSLR